MSAHWIKTNIEYWIVHICSFYRGKTVLEWIGHSNNRNASAIHRKSICKIRLKRSKCKNERKLCFMQNAQCTLWLKTAYRLGTFLFHCNLQLSMVSAVAPLLRSMKLNENYKRKMNLRLLLYACYNPIESTNFFASFSHVIKFIHAIEINRIDTFTSKATFFILKLKSHVASYIHITH